MSHGHGVDMDMAVGALPALPPMAAVFDGLVDDHNAVQAVHRLQADPPGGTATTTAENVTMTAAAIHQATPVATDITDKQQQEQQEHRKSGGSRKGSKRTDRPQSHWYRLCELFEAHRDEFKTQVQFLRSDLSGPEVCEDHRMSFSRAYKKYKNGTLKDVVETRCRKRKYEPLEERVVEYITRMTQLQEERERQEEAAGAGGNQSHDGRDDNDDNDDDDADGDADGAVHDHDEVANNNNNNNNATNNARNKKRHRRNPRSHYVWVDVQEKAKEWARELGVDDAFQASAGWVDNVMKRHARNVRSAQERQQQLALKVKRKSEAEQQQAFERAQAALQKQAHVELAVVQKRLQVGDRVTVLEASKEAGDFVIRELQHLEPYNPTAATTANTSGTTNRHTDATTAAVATAEEPIPMPRIILERKQHGTTETLIVTDVRKVVKFHAHDEDSQAIHKWLPTMITPSQQDEPYMTSIWHYSQQPTNDNKPYPIRPLWEQKLHDRIPPLHEEHKYAEKINITALRGKVMTSVLQDQKERQTFLDKLNALEMRTPAQEHARRKLQQAHVFDCMAMDLLELLTDVPQCSVDYVTYEVRYQTLDQSGRGALFAQSPNGVAVTATKPYYPRTLTMQCLPESLRRPLVGKFCHEIACRGDTVMSLVSLVCSLATTQLQASDLISTWIQYRDHPDHWNALLLKTHAGIEAHQATMLPLCLIQGGRYETWQRIMEEHTSYQRGSDCHEDNNVHAMQDFVFRLQMELRTFRDVLLQCPKFKEWIPIDRAALLQSGNYTNAMLDNVLMMRILHACEREILSITQRVFVDHGWQVRARGVSSLFVEARTTSYDDGDEQENNSKKKRADLAVEAIECTKVRHVAEAACHSRGYVGIKLAEQPLFGLQWGPMAMLEEGRKAMRELRDAEIIYKGTANVDDDDNDDDEADDNNESHAENNGGADDESADSSQEDGGMTMMLQQST